MTLLHNIFMHVSFGITVSVYYENIASSARKFTIFSNAVFFFLLDTCDEKSNKQRNKEKQGKVVREA